MQPHSNQIDLLFHIRKLNVFARSCHKQLRSVPVRAAVFITSHGTFPGAIREIREECNRDNKTRAWKETLIIRIGTNFSLFCEF